MKLKNVLLSVLVTALALPLYGCFTPKPTPKPTTTSKSRYKLDQDTAPHHSEPIPDISQIPDAKPIPEPKSKYGNPKTYTVMKKSYSVLPTSKGYKVRGKASWYGKKFHGYRTSNGETYDMYAMSAAHKTLPLPTYAKVTNLDNGKSVIVKINDRGPFHDDRVIDLSYAAASKLGILNKGTGNVEIHAIDLSMPGPKQFLQIGAYVKKENAQQMAAKLQKVTKKHPITVKQPANKNKLYHVHIGPIHDPDEILQLKNILVANKFPSPVHIELE